MRSSPRGWPSCARRRRPWRARGRAPACWRPRRSRWCRSRPTSGRSACRAPAPRPTCGVVGAEQVLAVARAVHPRADHRARRGQRGLAPADVLAHDPGVVVAEVADAREALDERAAVGRLVGEEALGHHPLRVAAPRRSRAPRSRPAAPTPLAARCWLSRQSVAWPTTATLSAAGTRSAPAQSSAVRGRRRAQGERCERCHGGESAAGHAPSSAGRGPAPPNGGGRWTNIGPALSAASARRCGPSARRRARGPPPPCRSSRRASARDRPPRRARRRASRRRSPGSPRDGTAGRRSARRRRPAGPSRRAPAPSPPGGRSKTSSCHVNQRPPKPSSPSTSIQPISVSGGAAHRRPQRGRKRLAAEADADHRARRASCAARRNATWSAIHGSFEACTERSEPRATTAVEPARVGPGGDRGRVDHVDLRAPGRRPLPHQPGRSVGLLLDDEQAQRLPLHAEGAAHERMDAAEVRVGPVASGSPESATACGWRPA